MNNLPLQPLVWSRALTAQSAFHQYLVRKDDEANKRSKSQYVVNYGRLNTQKSMNIATGFATIDEAKAWAWRHYNKKMQPYVKPLPAWIDVNERLPKDDGKYLVATSCGKQWMGNYNLPPKPNEWMLNGWSMNGGWHPFDITHWMPIPEFSTMQNLHKWGDCE